MGRGLGGVLNGIAPDDLVPRHHAGGLDRHRLLRGGGRGARYDEPENKRDCHPQTRAHPTVTRQFHHGHP